MLLNVFAAVLITLIGPTLGKDASTTTTSAPVATHTVSVGADGFNFSPSQVFANVGDIIEYRFYPQNHSVARAAFGSNPCIPYEDTGPGLVGFWSGFRPVALVLSNPPIFSLPINDTDPVFFYCSAPGACLQGMVGVVNPNSSWTYEAQFNYTQNATIEFSPLEYFPKEEAPTRTTTATGATATPTAVSTSSSAATTSSAPALTAEHKSSISTGAIVGIAIGGVAVIALAGALIYMCGRQRTVKQLLRQSQPAPTPQPSYLANSPGMSEAQYANMYKGPAHGTTHYSGQSYGGPPATETESYRSISPPPPNEHTHMMGGLHPSNFHPDHSVPTSIAGSPGFPSPAFSHELMEPGSDGVARPYNPDEHHPAHLNPNQARDDGPHELAVPSRNPSTAVGPPTPQNQSEQSRPFSYSHTPQDEKSNSTFT
ncbi:putative GPI-anchored cupredoxin [Lachnellula hyalina]|uniref:Putative GPI-anchored cupredoxin n=1 Tax=Lachnellula hyalina TaxID=1316788 RepID=A0A8H8QTN0_9HELO|nr:putative GPI-anchored cupredoxin [Lachnellula hyalina]TVY22544.1 putative GPI-anchored cupredoxin [Lachnellula hyalina]